MSEESSLSKGFGWGCGLYLGITMAMTIVPMLLFFMCCGGCAVFTGGSVATVATVGNEAIERANENKRQMEAEREAGEVPAVELESLPIQPAAAEEPPAVEMEDTQPPQAVAEDPPPAQEPIIPSQLPDSDDSRVFTTADGKFSVRAKYIEFQANGGIVVLTRSDNGKEIKVKMSTLSTIDQGWIREENKHRAAMRNSR